MQQIDEYVATAESAMKKGTEYLEEKLARIRAGKANPKLLDDIRVEYYGHLLRLAKWHPLPSPMHVAL